jgi:hypothetical protein
MEINMAKFATDWVYLTPMRTIEFPQGHETIDAEIIAAAELAGVLAVDIKELANGDGNENQPATQGKAGRTLHIKA